MNQDPVFRQFIEGRAEGPIQLGSDNKEAA